MRPPLSLVLAVLLTLAVTGCSSPVNAAPSWRRAVLVELYTSQGCSSCPAADGFVGELPRLGYGRDKVIPLTFHVDYWDRLGWKDPFASAAFTDRQEWYATSGRLRPPDGVTGLDGLYTPQMIVDGTVHFSGQRRQVALRELERAAARPSRFELGVQPTVHGTTVDLTVRVEGSGPPYAAGDWRVLAALAAKRTRTSVHHGENAGETLDEVAVVRALSERLPIPPARGAVQLRLSKPADVGWTDIDLVVFVQSETTREIGGVRTVDVGQWAAILTK